MSDQPSISHRVRARYIGDRKKLRSADRHATRTHLDENGEKPNTVHIAAGHSVEESAHNVWGYTQLHHTNADQDHPQQPPIILGLGIRLLPEHVALGYHPLDVVGRPFWYTDGTQRQYEFHEARTDMEPLDEDQDPSVPRSIKEFDALVARRAQEAQAQQNAAKPRRSSPPSVPTESAPAATEQGQGA